MGEPVEATEKPDPIQATLDWWRPLVAPQETGKPSNRGDLAALRRCKNLEEVLFVPAYHRLYYRLSALNWTHRLSVAAVAGLLAHVKGDSTEAAGSNPVAGAMGQQASDSQSAEQPPPRPVRKFAAFLATPTKRSLGPRVSELRFQRLVAIRDLHELYPSLLRTIHLAGERVPLADLIGSLRYWTDHQRRDWVQHYYDTLLQQQPDKRSQGA